MRNGNYYRRRDRRIAIAILAACFAGVFGYAPALDHSLNPAPVQWYTRALAPFLWYGPRESDGRGLFFVELAANLALWGGVGYGIVAAIQYGLQKRRPHSG